MLQSLCVVGPFPVYGSWEGLDCAVSIGVCMFRLLEGQNNPSWISALQRLPASPGGQDIPFETADSGSLHAETVALMIVTIGLQTRSDETRDRWSNNMLETPQTIITLVLKK